MVIIELIIELMIELMIEVMIEVMISDYDYDEVIIIRIIIIKTVYLQRLLRSTAVE
jgi:hypothetical protein